jgi:hypothetical protein
VTSVVDEFCTNKLVCPINGDQGPGMKNSKNNRILKACALHTGADTAFI